LKLCLLKVGLSEIGPKEVPPVQVSPSKTRAFKIGVVKVGAMQDHPFKNGGSQVEVTKLIGPVSRMDYSTLSILDFHEPILAHMPD